MSCCSTSRPWALQTCDGVYHQLRGPNFFVGRAESLDLTLKSRSVDKRHAVITVDEEKETYQLHDLGSLNGTFVNQVRIRQPVTLKLWDKVRFGYDVNTFRVDVFPKERSFKHSHLRTLHNNNCEADVNNNTTKNDLGSSHLINKSTLEDHSQVSLSTDSSTNQLGTSPCVVSHQAHPFPAHTSYPVPSYSASPPQFHHRPVFHGMSSPSQPSHCPCLSCSHSSTYYPHPYGYQIPSPDHQGYQHYSQSIGHAPIMSVRPKLPQRPISAPGDCYNANVKRSPLYGQPPWWGWGSSDEEVYSYPNTSTIVSRDDRGGVRTTQHTVILHNKDQSTKPKYDRNTHTVGSVSMVSKSKTARLGKTVREQAEYVIVRKKSSLSRKSLSDESSPISEVNSSVDWEAVDSDQWQSGNELRLEDFDSKSNENLKMVTSFEVPELLELPEKPINVKRVKEARIINENVQVKKNTGDKKHRKTFSNIEGNYGFCEAKIGNNFSADTIESDAESCHGCQVNRVAASSPLSGVFGLTEIKLKDKHSVGPECPPSSGLPSWVQEWSRVDDSFSALTDLARDQTATRPQTSSPGSTSSSSSLQDGNFTESKPNNDKVSPQSSSSTRLKSSPASGSSRRSPNSGRVGRSHSVASTMIGRQSSSKSTLARRSHTIAASISRSVPHGGGSPRSSRSDSIHSLVSLGSQPSLTCSTCSDESDGESSENQSNGRRRENSVGIPLQAVDHNYLSGKSPNRASPVPRGNKATMLRVEAAKGSKTKTRSDKTKSLKSRTSASGLKKTRRRSESTEDQMPVAVANNWTKDSQKISDNETKDIIVEKKVDEIFSAGRSPVVPNYFKMDRNDKLNRTFVLEEVRSSSPGSSPDHSPCKNCQEHIRNGAESCDCQTPTVELPIVQSTDISPQGKVVTPTSAPKPIPFAPLQSCVPYVPSTDEIKPFRPPCLSPESKSFESFSLKGRPASPESQVSGVPSSSPPPPSYPTEEAMIKRRSLERGLSSNSQVRRTWGVTDKPVEDLMISSIHAFTVELRLASDSALSKVKKIYDGDDEEKQKKERNDLHPETKGSHESAMPDWKSSHAEIAGIFRNLRKVELSLRTMDQALSTMCIKTDSSNNTQTKQSKNVNQSRQNFQNWKDFKKRARTSSWALEHKAQFPDAAESDDDDDDDNCF